MLNQQVHLIVLAAGKGTRMNSDLPKVLHSFAGKTMISHIIGQLKTIFLDRICVVIGYQGNLIINELQKHSISFVEQTEQLGTGHAVIQTESAFDSIPDDDVILILPGDVPLITADLILRLIDFHDEQQHDLTILSTILDDPGSYGRLLRSNSGDVLGICEFKDCTPQQRLIQEINSGIYLVRKDCLFRPLKQVTCENQQKEYYLTDIVHLLNDDSKHIGAYCIEDSICVKGVNTCEELAFVSQVFQKK